MTEKRFVYYEHKGADYILDNPNKSLDFIEMLGDTLTSEEIVDLLNEQHETITTQKHIIDKQEIRLNEFENVLQRLSEMQDPINATVFKEIVKKELGVELQ